MARRASHPTDTPPPASHAALTCTLSHSARSMKSVKVSGAVGSSGILRTTPSCQCAEQQSIATEYTNKYHTGGEQASHGK
eukprot:2568164-Pyramimonas_sp.AAC.2